MSYPHERIGFPRTYLRTKYRTEPIRITFPYYKYGELKAKRLSVWAKILHTVSRDIRAGDKGALGSAKYWQLQLWVFYQVYIHPTREFHSISEEDYITWLQAEIERQEAMIAEE